MDVDKMKVAELRAALSERGLDTKGTKPILVSRLKDFFKSESAAPAAEAAAPEAVPEPEPAAAAPAPVPSPKKASPAKGKERFKLDYSVEKTFAFPFLAAPVAAQTPEKPAEEKSEPMEVGGKQEDGPKVEKAKLESSGDAKPQQQQRQNQNQNKRGQKRKRNDDEPFVVNEDEPEIDENFLCFDWFNSDVTMKIDRETHMGGEPFYKDGWGYIWSGARATHGFTAGKLYFEVKLTEHMEAKLEGEKNLHELRLGWSTDDSPLTLGEYPTSACFSGSGKKGKNSVFEEYGQSFAKDDVVASMIEFTRSEVIMSFAKNGENLGEAFRFPKSELAGKPFFPHVSSRNVKFDANFGKNKDGSDKEPWHAQAGFTFVGASVKTGQRGFPR